MQMFFKVTLIVLASINLLLTGIIYYRLRQPTTLFRWGVKVFVCGLSPVLFLAGTIIFTLGFFLDSVPAVLIGGLSGALYLIHIVSVSRAPDYSTSIEKAFGLYWQRKISRQIKNGFLSNRYAVRLPETPEPILKQNISFYTIPETQRNLLCDVWEPPKHVQRSGLSFIYLHGSAWAVLDKDFGTRPFFRHLTNQGHVIMDVAYRLFPEADMMGMLHDTKHAIAWMKEHAAEYGVDPDRIVIGGGSAGGHLALLAAYTNQNNQLTPKDLESVDLDVCGVISLYGQSDLTETFYHTAQDKATHSALGKKKKGEEGGMPSGIQKRFGKSIHRLGFDKDVEPGMLIPILGGDPKEKPDLYSLFSPVLYVNENCPPTLILHGEHDILAPLNAMLQMHSRLLDEGVPVVLHTLPYTDHAFDLILPKISPAAHNAIYEVERFLAIMASREILKEKEAEIFEYDESYF